MLLLLFMILCPYVLCTNQLCPGGTFQCSDTATCCELADQSYGCCPLKNAVCCDDHIHCCPEGTKCQTGICVQPEGTNITAKGLSVQEKDIRCFGTGFLCPDDSTCCRGPYPHTYACCPMKNAICCSDGYHCCPDGTVCNTVTQQCVGKGFVAEMYDSHKNKISTKDNSKYMPLMKSNNVTSVICPSSSFQCPDSYTCCKLPTGDWGCCPFPKATCCEDHLHCCPEDMKCDKSSQTCFKGPLSVPSKFKELSKPLSSSVNCPDNSTCAESMTCCKLSNEHYGCCPYDNAVCCQDQRHCCPSGSVCDDVEKQCISKDKKLSNYMPDYYVNMV